jgi:hypothetical protein
LVLVEAPRDPNAAEFQLGDTLGPAYRHWRRKKVLGRFWLYLRFWTNDSSGWLNAGWAYSLHPFRSATGAERIAENSEGDVFRQAFGAHLDALVNRVA